ncbi:MAG: hypothetical protein HOL98_16695 [Gammaproteobacteria bacterium]|jgi:hypothetical protein|nr:hypothetical protein [Gammaproteobacteria bacterium]MBT5205100.1 hypothetical protein [Gammaproteobacteria bacterium]MBT5601718.1 hypothetical protein [Gammaproteobacteria bacterium]MBT6245611.1 hypothetical protein [Gammaproteobacteria bacterium]
MATLILNGELEKLAGCSTITISSVTYRGFIEEVVNQVAGLSADRLMEMALAIDGEIIHEPLLVTIPENSELHFVFKISGG